MAYAVWLTAVMASTNLAPSSVTAPSAVHDWEDCLDCVQDGCNIDEHPYNPTTAYDIYPDPAETLAAYTTVIHDTVTAASLTDVVTVRSSDEEVALVCAGETLRDKGVNADSAEIALRHAGVPVKRFSVSSMYVAADPDIQAAVFLSPMPERTW